MKEKEKIEISTARAFMRIYNQQMGTSYSCQISDSPDIICSDSTGNQIKLEISLTEDREGDIPSLLGRSNKRNISEIEKEPDILKRVSNLQGNVKEILINRIKQKLKKDYGKNVALVIRDTSPLDWDWQGVIEKIKNEFTDLKHNFDQGVWIYQDQKIKFGKYYKKTCFMKP